jgi:hypothetical protein
MYRLRIQWEQKYTSLTAIPFVNAMGDSYDWLANNRKWKMWTGLGEAGSLSYAGIDFHKPNDEEDLIKEIKRRKKFVTINKLFLSFSLVKLWLAFS